MIEQDEKKEKMNKTDGNAQIKTVNECDWASEFLRFVPRVAMAQQSTPIEKKAEECSDGVQRLHLLDAVVMAERQGQGQS